MALIIRQLADGDSLSDLTKLLHAAYATLGQAGFNYTAVDQTVDMTRDRIATGECYVAFHEGRIIGTALFCRHVTGCAWYELPNVAGVHQLGVLPESQNRGIGNKLLRHVEARALETRATELALDTAEGAVDLVQWYSRHGYRPVDYAKWPGKTYRSVILSKLLI